jgi:two-component sensor histidine kinase
VQVRKVKPDLLRLAVIDSGIGFPESFEWRNADSLGLRIVQLLISQLDGMIELIHGPGTSFELLFPQKEDSHEHSAR